MINKTKSWIDARWFYRLLEIIPGTLSWGTLLLPVILSIWWPELVALWIILFDLYWLFKGFEMAYRLIKGFLKVRQEDKIDYFSKLKKLTESEIANPKMKWEDIYHVVLLPSYNEPAGLIRESIESYLQAKYPKDKIIVVLALEERAGEKLNKRGDVLQREFRDKFADFLVYVHPDGVVGELKGKSANATYAGRQLQHYLDEKGINYNQVILSNFDCDTRVHPQYFANLSYKYLTTKRRTRKTYQPIPMYSNNIWDVPVLTRTVSLSTSFWQMIEGTRSYRMVNFSSQAMSMKTLVDIDFWDVTIVSEDSKQYYRAMFKYGGDHEVIPIFTPVYMHAVLADSFWQTCVAQYMQMRRWSWGIEHFPYLVRASLKDKTVSGWKKIVEIGRMLDGHFSWATASIFIATAAWFPFLMNNNFLESPWSFYLPFWASRLLTVAMSGLFISMAISFLLLPPKPPKYGSWNIFEMVFMWVLVIVNATLFGSLPAMESQTRLMFGWYLGFWVADKGKKSQ